VTGRRCELCGLPWRRCAGHGRATVERVVTEASQLDWPPGTWPESFAHDGATFTRERAVRSDGELVAVVYHGSDGRVLEVLND